MIISKEDREFFTPHEMECAISWYYDLHLIGVIGEFSEKQSSDIQILYELFKELTPEQISENLMDGYDEKLEYLMSEIKL